MDRYRFGVSMSLLIIRVVAVSRARRYFCRLRLVGILVLFCVVCRISRLRFRLRLIRLS